MISEAPRILASVCEGLCTSNNTGLPPVAAGQDQVTVILQLAFGIIGAVALIFVILGGIQFVTSQGDPQSATKARQTIIYAVIGLVVALSAEAIVTFVLGTIG